MSDFKPCRGCGAQLHVTAVTCPKCGAPQAVTAASQNAPASALPTATLRYSDIPFYRRRWCFTLMFLVLMPVAMLVALTGPLYRLRKQTVEKLPTSWRVTYILLAVVWIGLAVAEFAVMLNRGGVFSNETGSLATDSGTGCSNKQTLKTLKELFLTASKTPMLSAGIDPYNGSDIGDVTAQLPINITGIRTNPGGKNGKKLSCAAMMEITLPPNVSAKVTPTMAQALFEQTSAAQSVQTEGNVIRAQIEYTVQATDNGKDFYVELDGYQGLLQMIATAKFGGHLNDMVVAPSSQTSERSTEGATNSAGAVVAAGTNAQVAVTAAATATPTTPTTPSAPVQTAAAAANVVAVPAKSQPPMCATGGKRVFVCITQTARKLVEVCELPTTISYTFGKPQEKPELSFAVPKAAASGYRWNGTGRYMNNSLNLPNGTTVYRVYSSIERGPSGVSSAGVEVVINGKPVADVKCDMDTERSDLESVDVKAE